MSTIVVIADELHAAGFRLAGAEVHHPAPEEIDATFVQALDTAGLVVLSRRSAEALAPESRRRAAARETPPVVVMPDITDPGADTGFVARMRALLGIES